MLGLKEQLASTGKRGPLILQAVTSASDLASIISEHRHTVEEKLTEHGALIFRGFDVLSVDKFDPVVDAISTRRIEYVYRSTPRKSLGRNILTATEFPAALEIPMHSENSYQDSWPLKIVFSCLIPASSGGETPVADLRRVTHNIGQTLLDEFESRRIKYIRHYRTHFDLAWQTVFQTDSPEEVAKFCGLHNIHHEWIDQETLRTTQVCQGTARHPVTDDRIVFNQAHLFHVSSLGDSHAKSLVDVFGADRLPRHACFGDDGEISAQKLDLVRSAFQAEAIDVRWQAGDVLLIDNMQFAHGRRSYQGARKIAAALLDSHQA